MKLFASTIAAAAVAMSGTAFAANYNFDLRTSNGDYTFTLDSRNGVVDGRSDGTTFSAVSVQGPNSFDLSDVNFADGSSLSLEGINFFSFFGAFNRGSGADITFTPGNYAGFDNLGDGGEDLSSLASLQINEAAVSSAPEPASWALMMLGVGFIGWALGYRKRVVVDHKAKLATIG